MKLLSDLRTEMGYVGATWQCVSRKVRIESGGCVDTYVVVVVV